MAVHSAPDWDQSQIPRIRAALVEGGIQANARTHHAQAVWADQTDAVAFRIFEQTAFQFLALGADLAKTGGDDDRCLDPMFPAFFDDVGNRLRWRCDDNQFDFILNFADGCIGATALHLGNTGVDRIERALKITLQHVVKYNLSNRIDAVACTEYSY
jgi:hypothetical protein